MLAQSKAKFVLKPIHPPGGSLSWFPQGIRVTHIHLNSWVRHCEGQLFCSRTQRIDLARSRTQTSQLRVQPTNHKATVFPHCCRVCPAKFTNPYMHCCREIAKSWNFSTSVSYMYHADVQIIFPQSSICSTCKLEFQVRKWICCSKGYKRQ